MSKMHRSFIFAALAVSCLLFLGGPAGAASPRNQSGSHPAATIGKTKSFNGNVTKGAYTFDETKQCPDGYADRCVSGTCECTTITGSFSNGTVGKGTIKVELTGDRIPTDGEADCWPLWVQGFIHGSKDTLEFEGNGSWCYSINSKKEPEIYVGGFDITESGAVHGGGGTYSGTVNFDIQSGKPKAVTFSLKGKSF